MSSSCFTIPRMITRARLRLETRSLLDGTNLNIRVNKSNANISFPPISLWKLFALPLLTPSHSPGSAGEVTCCLSTRRWVVAARSFADATTRETCMITLSRDKESTDNISCMREITKRKTNINFKGEKYLLQMYHVKSSNFKIIEKCKKVGQTSFNLNSGSYRTQFFEELSLNSANKQPNRVVVLQKSNLESRSSFSKCVLRFS